MDDVQNPYIGNFHLRDHHMDQFGLRPGWLLREAGHLHDTALAWDMGRPTANFRDSDGQQVMAVVVACNLAGDASEFRTGDECELFLLESPCAENGWRSQVVVANNMGGSLRAEIVTVFARWNGTSNRHLMSAEINRIWKPANESLAARRVDELRGLGVEDKDLARRGNTPAQRRIRVENALHINGYGLVYYAATHDAIAGLEADTVEQVAAGWPMRSRRLHFFGNLDVGDTMELSSSHALNVDGAAPMLTVRTHVRRGFDQAVIATCSSCFRV